MRFLWWLIKYEAEMVCSHPGEPSLAFGGLVRCPWSRWAWIVRRMTLVGQFGWAIL